MTRQPVPETVSRDASVADRAPARSALASLLVSLRPEQWTKNLVVFAGLLFGRQLLDPRAVGLAVAAFAIFCLLSGVVYLLNDVADREADRNHPLKSRRPIASGELAPGTALAAAALLGAVAFAGAFALGPAFGLVSLAYVALLGAYSARLKHMVIIDVLTIAIGFVLRAVAGAVVIEVPISQWLLVCTVLLALFLALSKRRHEIVLLAGGAPGHRRILGEYSPYLLDQMIGVVTASTLIAYIFYTLSPETAHRFETPYLGLTTPFPLYGIFRYLYLVHQKEGGGSPSTMLLTDKPLLVCVALWAVSVVVIVYRPWGL
ncbi:MAG TPA: decaprenyl-phosphate phosphoribosyltransferase [Vicinamibacterales bacterium]|nr:decaprenyl-phosphate phosphoribosyltransferase [Acidobacteriota bacterium]HOC17725.1 decaprenyl-phosphate phosphoribosyltransferase [Vicinamibacterales bacterium]